MTTMSNRAQAGSAHVLIIGVAVAILIGALGWVFWQNVNKAKTSSAQNQAATTQATTKDAAATAPTTGSSQSNTTATASTKTFSDSEKGVSFSYPGDWTVSQSNSGSSLIVTVSNSSSQKVAYLETNLDSLGGAGQVSYTTLSSRVLGSKTGVFNCAFATQGSGSTYSLQYGAVIDTICAQQGSGTSAPIYMVLNTGLSKLGSISFSNYDYIKTGLGTQPSVSLDQAKQYIASNEYGQLKTMFDSLAY